MAELSVRIGANDREFRRKMAALEKRVAKFGRSLSSFGETLSRNISLPVLLGGGAAIKVFAEFEQTMAKVQAVSGAVGDEFNALNESAKELGRTSQFTASEIANLQLNLAKLGLNPTEILNATDGIQKLALATGEDLAQSATVAASTMRAFGLEATDMGRITDVMAASFSATALDLTKFEYAMGPVAGAARAVGLSIEETTAMLGTLINNGAQASTAGVGLRKIFIELAASGMTLDQAFELMSSSTDPLSTAVELFGDRAAVLALNLMQNRDATADLVSQFNMAKGAASSMAGIMEDTLQGSFIRLQSAIEGAGIAIGEVIGPSLRKLADWINKAVTAFNEMDRNTKEMIVIMAGLAAAIGPVLFVVGKLVTMGSSLISVFALGATPIGAVAAALGVFAAGVIWAYKNSEEFRDSVNRLIQGVGNLGDKIGELIGKVKGMTSELKLFKSSAFDASHQLSEFAEAFAMVIEGINDLFELNFVDGFRRIMGGMLDASPFGRLADAFGFDIGDWATKGMVRKFNASEEEIQRALTQALYGDRRGLEDTVGVAAPTTQTAPQPSQRGGNPIQDLADDTKELTRETEKLNTGVLNAGAGFKSYDLSIGDIARKIEDGWRHTQKLSGATIGFGDAAQSTDDIIQRAAETVGNYKREIQELPPAMENMAAKWQDASDAVGATLESGLGDALLNIGESFGSMLSGAAESGDGLRVVLGGIADVMKEVGKLIIQAAVAMIGIKKAFNFGNPITAIIAGTALIALASAFKSQLAKKATPKLAEGGLAFGPTLAVVGDNPGASSNPEVIAPLDKLKSMMGGNNVNVTGEFRIRGTDLVLAVERAQREMNRIR